MASGMITIRVRPLRVGFLVDPADRAGLQRAIELGSFLWGGSYNPIIPAYRRTPAKWEPRRFKPLPPPSEIVEGYLDGFDPDLVVPVGICENREFQIGNREIVSADELIGELKDSAAPQYGIGIIEILNDVIEKELKYKRNDDLQVVFAELPRAHGLFLASLLGSLPKEAQKIIDEHFLNIPGISKIKPTMKQFPQLLKSKNLFSRRLTFWTLQPPRHTHGSFIFVCNAKSNQDIIDYWNLRAAGYIVVPIPIQVAGEKNVKDLAVEFIEESYRPYRHNAEIFHRTTILKSRSLTEDAVQKFCQSLTISKNEQNNEPKYLLQWWYPRLWDAWARENTSEGIAFSFSHDHEVLVPEGDDKLSIRSQDPKFEMVPDYSGKPRFANEFSFRFYGLKEPMAEVFPEGTRELSTAVGRTGYFNWRFAKLGPVFLAHNS
jgi:hypothetical protein